MWKKILLSIGIIILIVIGVELYNLSKKGKEENQNTNIVKNETELSSKYVKDDCINEWADYSKSKEEEIKETSGSINDENRKYILKDDDAIIDVYYINENGEEILYKVTDISTKYLGESDVEELKRGIEVTGIQELNKILEDFE